MSTARAVTPPPKMGGASTKGELGDAATMGERTLKIPAPEDVARSG
jgi:hypothetical protein